MDAQFFNAPLITLNVAFHPYSLERLNVVTELEPF